MRSSLSLHFSREKVLAYIIACPATLSGLLLIVSLANCLRWHQKQNADDAFKIILLLFC